MVPWIKSRGGYCRGYMFAICAYPPPWLMPTSVVLSRRYIYMYMYMHVVIPAWKMKQQRRAGAPILGYTARGGEGGN